MTTLLHRRLTPASLSELFSTAPTEPVFLTDDHRRSLGARFRAVPTANQRRIDAWSVETAAKAASAFSWSPGVARRVIGNAALRRVLKNPGLTLLDAVNDEIAELYYRSASGVARGGSLAFWIAGVAPSVVGLVSAEALNWATQLGEIAETIEEPWDIYGADAYYDVATARTTLRGRRDILVGSPSSRVVLRVRAGMPGKSAGPGLRADLTIETLATPNGLSPQRIIGLWPEAGVALSVDGTMDDLRAGARDLVRTSVVQQRVLAQKAA